MKGYATSALDFVVEIAAGLLAVDGSVAQEIHGRKRCEAGAHRNLGLHPNFIKSKEVHK